MSYRHSNSASQRPGPAMARKAISLNTARRLWAQCAGFCQRPTCNKPLFSAVGDEPVSLANVAHIVGYGSSGPRSDHELAQHIDRDGLDNLVMLCLECHNIVDVSAREPTPFYCIGAGRSLSLRHHPSSAEMTLAAESRLIKPSARSSISPSSNPDHRLVYSEFGRRPIPKFSSKCRYIRSGPNV